ncbi:hypothetical protein F971_00158 [Acinetobacter vivianii]|uniref:Membrane fusion protein biotin-lipoyl like domain-containing protein n=1 Tax=Acinetobacter vivianii TaxID=1776742 RepID=N8V315_9GAMM|nr:hypothetical protein F971_00158 [Acinetobacter vivianii]
MVSVGAQVSGQVKKMYVQLGDQVKQGQLFAQIDSIRQENDFKNKVWIIPKERMKAEKEHRVPLSQQAISLLESIKDNAQPSDFIFPARRSGEMLSDMSLTTLIKRMHEQKLKGNSLGYIDPKQNRVITTHGFRSTFRGLVSRQN